LYDKINDPSPGHMVSLLMVADKGATDGFIIVRVRGAEEMVSQSPSNLTRYVVLLPGAGIMILLPLPRWTEKRLSAYHSAVAPCPRLPPVYERVTEPSPGQIESLSVDTVTGAMETGRTLTVVDTVAVVSQVPSNLK
jgi:hypothetical protein